jgi:two-component system cell cycle sensor histidine kinase/response regulator CckA
MRSKSTDIKKKAGALEKQVRNLGKEKQALLQAREMAVNLSNFQSSLNQIESSRIILETTAARVREIIRFKVVSFYLVNEQDSSFYQAYCDPEESSPFVEQEVKVLIDDKTFSLALRMNKPTIVTSADGSEQIMLHPLFTSSRTRGMFLGILAQDRKNISDISLILFTMAIVANVYALESFGLYQQIKNMNKELEANIIKMKKTEKELTKANKELQQDILGRRRAEKALKEAEEKFRGIFENAVEGIFQVAPDGYYISANPSLARIHGYETPAELINSIRDIAGQLCVDRKQYDEFLQRIDQDGIIRNLEMQMFRKNGSTNWVSINARAVRDEKGALLYCEGTMMDITETKILESQLRQAQKMEAIGTLAGGIAHDFNNILNAIMGYTEIALIAPAIDDNLRLYLTEILKASERARDLVKQILTFSRKSDEKLMPLRISPIIREVLKLLKASLPSTITIYQDLQPDPNPVLADPTQIHQILMNLCTNAASALRERKGEIRVSLIPEEIRIDAPFGLVPGMYLKLTVSDTGSGIEPAIIDRIFDPFFTTKKPGEGTGMGLSVVYSIVKSYGGAVTVQSEVGKGTEFSIYLPLLMGKVDNQEAKADESVSGGKECILFVDDEVMLVELGKNILTGLGYDVVGRTSSVEALELFRTCPERFDLIVTDMTMPNMTGIELAKKLLQLKPDIPIIICTGFSETSTAENVKSIGVKDLIMKPFVRRQIAESIRRTLDKRE